MLRKNIKTSDDKHNNGIGFKKKDIESQILTLIYSSWISLFHFTFLQVRSISGIVQTWDKTQICGQCCLLNNVHQRSTLAWVELEGVHLNVIQSQHFQSNFSFSTFTKLKLSIRTVTPFSDDN